MLQRTPTTQPGNDTRSKLLSKAAALSQTVGYDALSLQDLANELGIRKASIFHYFSSKDDLACAIVKTDISVFDEWCHSVAHLQPRERLASYFEYYRAMIIDGQVSPGGAFAISWPLLPGKVQSTLIQMHKQQVNFMEMLIRDGVADGSFAPLGISSDIAKTIPDMLQGAIQVGRAGASVIPINRLERIVKTLLNCPL